MAVLDVEQAPVLERPAHVVRQLRDDLDAVAHRRRALRARRGLRQPKKQTSGFQGSRDSSGWSGKGATPRLTDWMLCAWSSSSRPRLSLKAELEQNCSAKPRKLVDVGGEAPQQQRAMLPCTGR